MAIPIDKIYNIINQVMNDGAGDYAWSVNLLNFLLSQKVPQENIRLIYFNVYDYDQELKKLLISKISTHLDEFSKENTCKTIIDLSTINKDDTIKRYIFKKNTEAFNFSLYHDKKLLKSNGEKLYSDTNNLTPTDFYKINEIMDKILYSEKITLDKISKNDIICEISDETYKSIYGSTFNDKLELLRNPEMIAFPINRLKELYKDYPEIKIFYFDAYKQMSNLKELKLFNTAINLVFLTQENDIILDNYINLREGGQSLNGALNCSLKYGYIQAEPKGDDSKLQEYRAKLKLNLNNTCISYISTGSIKEVPQKLSKFIKIICYSPKYLYVDGDISSIYTILMINHYDTVFPLLIDQLDKDLVVRNIDNEYYEIIFNTKKIHIKKSSFINLNNGFNFAYLLSKTNEFCYLSGDNSYMEGLTLNKRCVHIGMINKYNMIQELQNSISRSLGITNISSYEKIDIARNKLDNKSIEQFSDYNILLKNYSEFISNDKYLEYQKPLVKTNFYDTLTTAILNLRKEDGNYYNKYLKYKEKYLSLKHKLK